MVTAPPLHRVTVEVERMSKGPAKVTVTIRGEDSEAVAAEALSRYCELIAAVAEISGE